MNDNLTIGVMLGNVASEHSIHLLSGVCKRARERNVQIMSFTGVYSSDYNRDGMDEDQFRIDFDYQGGVIYNYAAITKVDGYILTWGMIERYLDARTRNILLRDFQVIPTVFVMEDAQTDYASSITTDNYGAEYAIAEHMIVGHGKKHIIYVSGPEGNEDASIRLRAIRDCCRDYKVEFSNRQIARGDFSPFVSRQIEALLDRNPEADALIAANDEMAHTAFSVLKGRGISIGEQMMVAGFDDDPGIAPIISPPLTTAHQNPQHMGESAVDMCLELIHGGMPRHEIDKATLVLRCSCGCHNNPTIAQYQQELGISNSKYRTMHKRAMEMPAFSRSMIDCVKDDERFYTIAANHLKEFGCKAAWLVTTPEPITHLREQNWVCPSSLDISFQMNEEGTIIFSQDDCPHLISSRGFRELTSNERNRTFFLIPLFSAERQHGLLIMDVDPENLYYCYLASLQIESALDFRTLSQQMEEKNRWLEAISRTDPLTKALNRRAFEDIAGHAITNNRGRSMRLFFCDMDHLKQINDTFGHDEGDYAIRAENTALQRAFHRAQQIIARFGGDEFVVLDTDSQGRDPIEDLNNIKQSLEEINDTSGKDFYVEVSVGYMDFTAQPGVSLEYIISGADSRLYEAKKLRRKNVFRNLSGDQTAPDSR